MRLELSRFSSSGRLIELLLQVLFTELVEQQVRADDVAAARFDG